MMITRAEHTPTENTPTENMMVETFFDDRTTGTIQAA